MNSALKFKGRFDIRHLDKHGRLKQKLTAHNGVTNIGKDTILDVMFHAATQITAWFVGLIDASGFSALAAGDTMVAHGGWVESQAYDEGTRPAWPEDAPASQQITNSTKVSFTIDATGTIRGFFLVSDSAKGGTAGILWCTALFDQGNLAVQDNDVLEVKYTLSV